MTKNEVIIVGAGPGGLSCARLLAEAGVRVLVIERKKEVGPKVCGGGITWDGLIRRVPEKLIERSFCKQYIFSDWQQISVHESNPIVATISRRNLGRFMAEQAEKAGAEIQPAAFLRNIEPGTLTVTGKNGQSEKFGFDHLVGADGSGSTVRKYLNIPVEHIGMGINYQVPVRAEEMEWHFNTRFFGTGYSWIFPHQETTSMGVYTGGKGVKKGLSPSKINRNFLAWAEARGFDLSETKPRAGLVNYDYRGFRFDKNIWLVGDAAGLASGLTGEGIYPAIVSGETVANTIVDGQYNPVQLNRILKKQSLHNRVLGLAGRSRLLCSFIVESCLLALRLKLLDFRRLEMAD